MSLKAREAHLASVRGPLDGARALVVCVRVAGSGVTLPNQARAFSNPVKAVTLGHSLMWKATLYRSAEQHASPPSQPWVRTVPQTVSPLGPGETLVRLNENGELAFWRQPQ